MDWDIHWKRTQKFLIFARWLLQLLLLKKWLTRILCWTTNATDRIGIKHDNILHLINALDGSVNRTLIKKMKNYTIYLIQFLSWNHFTESKISKFFPLESQSSYPHI